MSQQIKIEAEDPVVLQELQQFVYEHQPDLEVDEQFAMQPGFHKEPIIISLVIALGGPVVMKTVQMLIKSFFAYKMTQEKEQTKREKDKLDAKVQLVKISLKEDKGWKYVDTDEFTEMKSS
jgi:hypothetical protein